VPSSTRPCNRGQGQLLDQPDLRDTIPSLLHLALATFLIGVAALLAARDVRRMAMSLASRWIDGKIAAPRK